MAVCGLSTARLTGTLKSPCGDENAGGFDRFSVPRRFTPPHRLRPSGPPCCLRESRKELRARLEERVERRGAELQQLFGEYGLGVDARK
ncbi:MAG: hypothetical protein QW334_04405, partial [Thermofilum sp.]